MYLFDLKHKNSIKKSEFLEIDNLVCFFPAPVIRRLSNSIEGISVDKTNEAVHSIDLSLLGW